MPNRKTHSLVGMTAGAGYAAYQAKGQSTSKVWAELLGGAVGGYFAGQLPDVLEPAIHPWHRSIAHSGTVATTVLATARTKAISWQDHCRKQAEACRIKRQSSKMVPHPSQPNLYVVDPSAQWEHLCLSIQELM